MAEKELTIEIADLNRVQICCRNPNCPAPEIALSIEDGDLSIENRCPACGVDYPEQLVQVLEYYIQFVEKASTANKSARGQISLRVQL